MSECQALVRLILIQTYAIFLAFHTLFSPSGTRFNYSSSYGISEIQWITLLQNIRNPLITFANNVRHSAPDTGNKVGWVVLLVRALAPFADKHYSNFTL